MHPRQQNIIFCFSLACSLLINTGMVGVMVLQNDARAPLNLISWQKKNAVKTTPGVLSPPLAEVFPPPEETSAASPDANTAAEPPPPPPPAPEPKPQKSLEFDNRDVFGETGGTGQALDSSPGAQPMLAHVGSQEQSYLGRNSPTAVGGGGAGGEGGNGGVPLIGAVSPESNATPQVRTPATPASVSPQAVKPVAQLKPPQATPAPVASNPPAPATPAAPSQASAANKSPNLNKSEILSQSQIPSQSQTPSPLQEPSKTQEPVKPQPKPILERPLPEKKVPEKPAEKPVPDKPLPDKPLPEKPPTDAAVFAKGDDVKSTQTKTDPSKLTPQPNATDAKVASAKVTPEVADARPDGTAAVTTPESPKEEMAGADLPRPPPTFAAPASSPPRSSPPEQTALLPPPPSPPPPAMSAAPGDTALTKVNPQTPPVQAPSAKPAEQQALAYAPYTPPSPAAPPSSRPAEQPQKTAVNPGRPGRPGAPGVPGPPNATVDSAPKSDKDSDPFAASNSFKYVPGQVIARNGRWVKTVRPLFTPASYVDATMMGQAAVTFLATVDAQGNVVNVVRYHSSGSDNIDLPCEEALNQWKIEPSKDKDGHPIRDVVSVTFGLE